MTGRDEEAGRKAEAGETPPAGARDPGAADPWQIGTDANPWALEDEAGASPAAKSDPGAAGSPMPEAGTEPAASDSTILSHPPQGITESHPGLPATHLPEAAAGRTVLSHPPDDAGGTARPMPSASPAANERAADMPAADRTILTDPPAPPLATPAAADTASRTVTGGSAPPRPAPRRSAGFEPTRLALPPHAAAMEAAVWADPQPGPQPAPEPAPRPKPRTRIQLPTRQRRYGFSLIAFADAMFQLLIFFMLASNLSTFSLLTISQGGGPGRAPGAAQAATPPGGGPGQTAIWTLSREGVTAGGQRFEMAQIARLAEGARAAGTGQVLLVTRSGAEVQGVVRVLEALARNGITSVQIAAPQLATGGAP